jgi:enoyl-CoA hydratase/carnithine racemase
VVVLAPITLGAILVGLPAVLISFVADLGINILLSSLGAWIYSVSGGKGALGASCIMAAVLGVGSGGVGLALCCDMRICTEGSKFGVPAAKLGLGYRFDGLKKLVDLVGPSFAKEIFFTARQFTAAEAQMMGLVNRVLPDSELESYVKDYADTIAANAPLTVDSVKYIVGQAVTDESKRDLNKCDELVQACFASNDYKEGRKAFMEKRKPAFTGS